MEGSTAGTVSFNVQPVISIRILVNEVGRTGIVDQESGYELRLCLVKISGLDCDRS
jgi:hypothetical protein